MNQKILNILGSAGALALIMVGISAMSYSGAYSRSAEPTSFRSFTVMGDGKAVGIPDVAEFTFGVVTQGDKDIAALQDDNTKKINAAIAFVKSKGVDAKDIKTENYDLSPRYQHCDYNVYGGDRKPCPPPEIVGYTITQTVSVKIRKFDTVGNIISGVVKNGANETSQLSFKVDDPTALQDEARAEAIEKAKAKAISIAKAGGFRLGRLLSIEESGGYIQPRYYDTFSKNEMMSTVASSPAPSIEAGSKDINVSVSLKFEIE